ncbi:MAG: Holliday junction branch migration protein RuvA [Patescibacteria group bacterium]|jgi:Holliday junction DNA helicase RuvA
MIGNIHGQVISKGLDWVLVDTTGGVGYKVSVTHSVLSSAVINEPISLLTHLIVREDQLTLYGFTAQAELEFFVQLISISGVGPRLALSVLNAGSVNELKTAIVSNNLAMLTMISGIGKKTAERIMVELKNRLDVIGMPISADTEDLLSALTGLGYNTYEVRKILTTLPANLASTEEKLKYALQLLGKQ